jgi:hypothetical protein
MFLFIFIFGSFLHRDRAPCLLHSLSRDLLSFCVAPANMERRLELRARSRGRDVDASSCERIERKARERAKKNSAEEDHRLVEHRRKDNSETTEQDEGTTQHSRHTPSQSSSMRELDGDHTRFDDPIGLCAERVAIRK